MNVYKYLVQPFESLTSLKLEYWVKYNVFSLRWWLMIIFLIFPWVIWSRFIDKKRLKEILLYGFFVLIFCLILDEVGTHLSFWAYPYILTPISASFEPYDYTFLPITFMLIYQYLPSWKAYIFAIIALSAVFSFILEPIVVYFDFYRLLKWRYEYSFVIYPLIGLFCKLIIHKIIIIECKK